MVLSAVCTGTVPPLYDLCGALLGMSFDHMCENFVQFLSQPDVVTTFGTCIRPPLIFSSITGLMGMLTGREVFVQTHTCDLRTRVELVDLVTVGTGCEKA